MAPALPAMSISTTTKLSSSPASYEAVIDIVDF